MGMSLCHRRVMIWRFPKMKTLFTRSLLLASMAVCSASSMASVTYDEAGVGFVGKGDIQSIYDWNNSQLQSNAAALKFRFFSTGTVSWKCEWYTGKERDKRHESSSGEVSTSVESTVSFDPRKNKQGQITGFTLAGTGESQADYTNIGDCGGIGAGKTLVEGSIKYEGSEEPMLQISVDDLDWFDLPLTL
jgi:hypothetical protein